jgi:hypothetical protein
MKKSFLLPVIFIFVGIAAAGQTAYNDSIFQRAQQLRKGYHFNEAISLYRQVLNDSTDSLMNIRINSLIAESENGLNMLQYATRPVVTAKATIPAKEFFLYYPDAMNWAALPDSISPLPDSLSKDTTKYFSVNPVYIRENSNKHYFSAPDENGSWDIYSISRLNNEMWSYPEKVDGNLNSTGNELFPYVSRDGKHLYFSSDGHFGMGGYDLYVSNWDEAAKEWGVPQNLGFPYSSVNNDLLIMHSEDGLHTYLASDRNNTPADSIVLYRMLFENTPIRRAVSTIEEARGIAALEVCESSDTSAPSASEIDVMTTPETEEYTRMIMEVKRIQAGIDSLKQEIDHKRDIYSSVENEQEKKKVEKEISDYELRMLDMQSLLRSANEVVQKREMEFLSKGTLIPRREELFTQEEQEQDSTTNTPLVINKKSFTSFPEINIMPPVELFDYTFRIEEESIIAEDQSLPDGIVYRIQLFALTSKNENIKLFKGLTPIFEGRNSAGRWIYYAGQFFSFEDASTALSKAKRSGFPGAIIAAFRDGRSVAVRTARLAEKEEQAAASYQVVIAGYPAGIPAPVLNLIQENTDRDIAMQTEEGKNVYYIGPFDSQQNAQQIVSLLENIGAQKVTIRELQ